MGAVKDMWQSEIDHIGEEYCLDHLTLEEAINELSKLGFNRSEAEDYLANCIA